MKVNIFFSITIFLCIINSCKIKEEALKPLPPSNVSLGLDTIWRSPLGYSITPTFNSEKDIFCSDMFEPNGDVFKLYDGVTGKLKWEWNDFFNPEEGIAYLNHSNFNDVMILCKRSRTYAVNMKSGQTLWRHKIDSLFGSPQIYSDNDGYIYHGFKSPTGFRSYIYSTKYDKGDWEPICSYVDSTNHFDDMNITPVAFSKNNKGEKIMIFTMYLFSKIGEPQTSIKVCGFNMVTNKYEWIKDYSDKYVEFMVCKMASNDTKVFTYAVYGLNRYLVAINANDGSVAWQQSMPDLGVGIYLYKDKLISLSNGSRPVICVDQNTGNIVWQQNFTPETINNFNFTFGDSKVFKNYLISTKCNFLLVLNLEDGSIVYNKKITLPNGCLQFGLEINEEKRWFYVQDRYYLNCYKLPDEVKY